MTSISRNHHWISFGAGIRPGRLQSVPWIERNSIYRWSVSSLSQAQGLCWTCRNNCLGSTLILHLERSDLLRARDRLRLGFCSCRDSSGLRIRCRLRTIPVLWHLCSRSKCYHPRHTDCLSLLHMKSSPSGWSKIRIAASSKWSYPFPASNYTAELFFHLLDQKRSKLISYHHMHNKTHQPSLHHRSGRQPSNSQPILSTNMNHLHSPDIYPGIPAQDQWPNQHNSWLPALPANSLPIQNNKNILASVRIGFWILQIHMHRINSLFQKVRLLCCGSGPFQISQELLQAPFYFLILIKIILKF